MAELESIQFTNPTSEDFTHRYNGEPYTVEAGVTRSFAAPVAFHLAKHLSTKIIVEEARKSVSTKELEDPKSKIHVKISQLSCYDTHERRIALYKIFNDTKNVLEVITRYPFKGFIGDMEKYKNFVEKPKKPEGKVAEKK